MEAFKWLMFIWLFGTCPPVGIATCILLFFMSRKMKQD